jgi:prepilin-type N-terminal cleavage/methylation domain-containing protein/prepilin-type processing-associated H-X9-DG protein
MRKRQNSGFTLVELLVVLAIIGILASLVIGGVLKGVQRGRSVKDAFHLRAIAMANMQFAADNDGFSVVCYTPTPGGPQPSRVWYSDLRPYFGKENNRIGAVPEFISPCDPKAGRGGILPRNDWRSRSYNVSWYMQDFVGGGKYEGRWIAALPARMIFVGNHHALESNNINPDSEQSLGRIPENWHAEEGFAQFAFLDGHVEMIEIEKLMPDGERREDWGPPRRG